MEKSEQKIMETEKAKEKQMGKEVVISPKNKTEKGPEKESKTSSANATEPEKKTEKKPVQEKKKKTEAVVMAKNIPISTKHSAAICRFIKNKKIDGAISDLEAVLRFKRAVPMKGEIPHRKGKGMMSGRFPKKASENFIRLLKSLKANSNYNGLEDPIIVEAVANLGERPFGRFGSVRKKRTHIKIVARDIQEKKPEKVTNK